MSFDWTSFARGFVTAGGTRLEAAAFGPPPAAAPTIVMLHEGLGCLAMWRDLPERLVEATGCGVFAYSRAGYGRSDPCALPRPLDYMTREAVAVLPEVLDAAGVVRAILFGHSDGATIAAIHAGSVSDARVRGLVLIAPHVFNEEVSVRAIAAAREAYDGGTLREKLARFHGDNVECAFRGWSEAWLDPGFRDWDVSDVIPWIRVPVLVIQGTADQYGSRAQIEAIEAGCMAPVELVELAARHHPQTEAAAGTLAAVADFVGRLRRFEESGAVAA